VLLGSEVLDEAGEMVLFSAALARSWYFLGLSSWVELDPTGGHRHPMIERFWSLPMRRSAVTKIKVLWVRYKSREILLEFERIECLVQNKDTDDIPVVADAP
jgi:hypothetical protein